MPYFKNNHINILFIHIPKTGGESVEHYFRDRYNIPLNNDSLYWFIPDDINVKHNLNVQSSLQHLPYKHIMQHNSFFNIDMNELEILTIVRNPYERIISDLFWFKRISIDTSKEDVYYIMQYYLIDKLLDNHNKSQSWFLMDENNQLLKNITIMRTETLTDNMIKLGYEDFNRRENCNAHKINCFDYLNNMSIRLINLFYSRDFKLFNYDKIDVSQHIDTTYI